MKKTILLFLLLVVGLTSIAQSRHFRDIVYLNDSSSIKGRIHFKGPDSTLFVDTPYGCTFAYTKDKVQRYQLESQMPFQRHKGFVLQSSMAAGYLRNSFLFDISFGMVYRIGSYYSIGLGTSWTVNTYFSIDGSAPFQSIFNVYLDQHISFSNKPISPFLDIKTGLSYNFHFMDPVYYYNGSRKTSLLGELDAGVSFRNIDLAFCYSISHNFYHSCESFYGLIGLRVGYSFPIN